MAPVDYRVAEGIKVEGATVEAVESAGTEEGKAVG